MERGGASYYYHFDGLGSVTNLTDSVGSTSESYNYDVFGKPSTTSTLGNRFMFTGREYDSETGLYYYRARYYSPTIGRFLQRDPVGYTAGINLYSYCSNNPINWVDPYGLDKQKDTWWKWGPENWLWQYLYKGGELVDPEFWKIWHREFYEHRMPPPISFFSLFPVPKATAVSIGLSKSVTGLENYAKAKSFSSVTTFSGTRDFVYFRGVPTASRWAQAAAAAKVVARYLNIATAAATGSDIGTAVYAYYEAFGEYYDRR